MRVLPSTIVIASVGAAATAAGTTLVAVYGFKLGDWWLWCILAVSIGIPVLLGAIARELILRASADRYRKTISDAALRGISIGLGGGGAGDGDGAGGGGGNGH